VAIKFCAAQKAHWKHAVPSREPAMTKKAHQVSIFTRKNGANALTCGEFAIGMSIAQTLLSLQAPQENSRGLSRSFGICRQNGRRGRIENLHVDP
jgi:hypothetical protein